MDSSYICVSSRSLPGVDTLIVEDEANTPGYNSIAQIASDILKFIKNVWVRPCDVDPI